MPIPDPKKGITGFCHCCGEPRTYGKLIHDPSCVYIEENNMKTQTPEEVDDDITEFGWRATQAGVPRNGIEPSVCEHEFVATVDEDGFLIDPPSDTCIHCGKQIY